MSCSKTINSKTLALILFGILGLMAPPPSAAQGRSTVPDLAECQKAAEAAYWHGRYAEAERLCRRALKERQRFLGGSEDRDVATILYYLGELSRLQGRYAEAEALAQRALAIRERVPRLEALNVARSLDTLVELYLAQGRLSEAEPLAQRTLAIRQKALRPGNRFFATSLHHLAELRRAQRKENEAEELYRQALAIRQQAPGWEAPSVATILHNLAELYRVQNRYAEAEPLYKRALALNEEAGRRNHPDVVAILHNLADLYRAQGRDSEAELLAERALAIREKVQEPQQPDVSETEERRGDGGSLVAEVIVYLLAFLGAPLLWDYTRRREQRRHKVDVSRTIRQLGFHLVADLAAVSRQVHALLEPLDHTGGDLAFSGKVGGRDGLLYEWSYGVHDLSPASGPRCRRAYILLGPGAPSFKVVPRKFFGKPATAIEFGDDHAFSRMFFVEGSDEGRVRRSLGPDLRRFLLRQGSDCSLLAGLEGVALVRQGQTPLTGAAEIRSIFEQLAALTEPADRR